MDYYNFLEEFDSYNEWNNVQKKQKKEEDSLDAWGNDYNTRHKYLTALSANTNDRVNSPSHYTSGKEEAIDIIEAAIKDAPTPGKGMLQGQVLKYMLRVWLKDNPVEDLKKARWYLDRLIDQLESSASFEE